MYPNMEEYKGSESIIQQKESQMGGSNEGFPTAPEVPVGRFPFPSSRELSGASPGGQQHICCQGGGRTRSGDLRLYPGLPPGRGEHLVLQRLQGVECRYPQVPL